MVPYAAFGRPKHGAVLRTVAGEYFHVAIIHLYRDADFQGPFRLGDDCLSVGIQIDQLTSLFP